VIRSGHLRPVDQERASAASRSGAGICGQSIRSGHLRPVDQERASAASRSGAGICCQSISRDSSMFSMGWPG
jgi:hypothetical protein